MTSATWSLRPYFRDFNSFHIIMLNFRLSIRLVGFRLGKLVILVLHFGIQVFLLDFRCSVGT